MEIVGPVSKWQPTMPGMQPPESEHSSRGLRMAASSKVVAIRLRSGRFAHRCLPDSMARQLRMTVIGSDASLALATRSRSLSAVMA